MAELGLNEPLLNGTTLRADEQTLERNTSGLTGDQDTDVIQWVAQVECVFAGQ